MEIDDRAGLLARRHQRVPVARVEGRKAQQVRSLGERDRLEPTRRVGPHLVRRHLGVEQPGDLTGDDPTGLGRAPLLDVPVVPRPHGGEREVVVAGRELEAVTAETR